MGVYVRWCIDCGKGMERGMGVGVILSVEKWVLHVFCESWVCVGKAGMQYRSVCVWRHWALCVCEHMGRDLVCVYSVKCVCVDKLWCLGMSGERERHVCVCSWRDECIWDVQERQVSVFV